MACPLQRALGTKSAGCRMACMQAYVSLVCFLLHPQVHISMYLRACVEVRRVGSLLHHGVPRIKGRLTVWVAKDACIFTPSHLEVHYFILGCYHLNAGGEFLFHFFSWKLKCRIALGLKTHSPRSPAPLSTPRE